MKLTPEQKEDLEQLTKMSGWKVLLQINEEANTTLFKNLSNLDLSNPQNIENIKEWQIYKNARRDFFKDTDRHLQKVYEHSIIWEDY